MSRNGNEDLERRVEYLESRVVEQDRELRRLLRRLEETPAEDPETVETGPNGKRDHRPENRLSGVGTSTNGADADVADESAPTPHDEFPNWDAGAGPEDEGSPVRLPSLPARLRSWEWWLNKVGIALLLLGVAFLFDFSVDRGWLTPAVRVGIGLSIGAALILVGLRVYGERRAFSQVLLGGGVGAFYVTGFAAFQLYELVSYPVAFGFMVAVTLLAFALALRQDGVSLSLVGAAGGYGTPFVLYSEGGDLGGLVIYACLVLAGTGAVYLYKGWQPLVLTSFAGVWSVYLVGWVGSGTLGSSGALWPLQAGVVFAGLVLWLAPVAREVFRSRRPARWPASEPGRLARVFFGDDVLLDNLRRRGVVAHLLAAVTPAIALAFTWGIWDLPDAVVGGISLGMAALFAVAAATLRPAESSETRLFYTHALVALAFATLALILVLEGDALLFALALEAAALHGAARRLSDRVLSVLGHAVFAAVASWLVVRLLVVFPFFWFFPGGPLFSVGTLVDLVVVALAFGVSVLVMPRSAARAYRILGHAALVLLIGREISLISENGAWTLFAWALYGAGLHLLSRRRPAWGTVEGAHVLWGAVALWLGVRLAYDVVLPVDPEWLFDLRSFAELAVIGLALASSRLVPSGAARVYLLAAHVALLAWLWRELSALPEGYAYVTVAWGLYAAGLLVAGLRLGRPGLGRVGLVTLFVVAGKLLLVDLAGVGAVWRILLFLGCGGLFLVLSYYVQSLWKPDAGKSSRDG